jgi:CheY-like chemotaxis protein/anti-sigma regulatory factor (Ser/Thr protein kinase)
LRAPLNSILGYAQLLEADNTIEFSKRSKISVIKRSGEHLADLIEGLLGISKIEAEKLQIHRDQVRISSLLDQIVYMFNLQAKEAGLRFVYQCITPLPDFVTTDEKRLRQILINLLSNAIKYTIEGEVSLTVTYKNQVAKFQIKDSGIGISQEELKFIFKPFERIRRPDVPSRSGAGLGLTIAKLLTDIIGGEFQVSESPTGGAIFTVSLMLSDIADPSGDTAPTQTVEGYCGPPEAIMVVDDNASHRSLIRDVLSPLSFAVAEASSGEDCLNLYRKDSPDLYFLDLSMPGKNGWEIAELLCKRGLFKPIIMLSANANERLQSSQHPDTIDDYIVKPIKTETLLDKLEQWLELEWTYKPTLNLNNEDLLIKNINFIELSDDMIQQRLIALAEIGHMTEFKRVLNEIERQGAITAPLIKCGFG